MKKITLICALFGLVLNGFGQQQLSTAYATLSIDAKGLLTIKAKNNADFIVNSSISKLWKLSVKNEKESNDFGPKIYQLEPVAVDIQQKNNEIILSCTQFKEGNRIIPIRAQFRIYTHQDAFCFSATLDNPAEEWLLRELTFPILTELKVKDNQAKVYWPSGLGQRFDQPVNFGKKSFDYPSGRASMQWFSINTPSGQGLYLASYDATRSKKLFELAFSKENNAFNTSLTFPLYQNSCSTPEVLLNLYPGQWYEAAKRYRAWYDQHFKAPLIPTWVQQDAGWVLAILKQQNGYVMWKYDELDKLCDIAEKLNFKTIGLFGWANGGHDYLYPNYIPDDLLGGRRALSTAIARAHQRGFKIVLYANGTLIDAGTEYYRYNGNETIALREDKSAYTSSIRKYNSASPVVFVEAAYSSKLWRKTMLDLALQAHELGADGILYDQVGVKAALMNFSKIQDHTLPQEAGTTYRYLMMQEIRTTLKKLNPEFVVMTEGVNDGVFTDIDYYHGWGDGTYIAPDAFPALFKYTFPELVKTQRHSSPMLPRFEANFATVYGQRHEIETRWEADVNYLKHGIPPTEKSYQDEAYFAPSPQSINQVPPAVATAYLRDLIAFEQQYADFFRNGKFIDEEGFKVSGPDILAKGFSHGKQLGIVVWNQHRSESRSFQLEVPGYRFVSAHEPENKHVEQVTPLKSNSLRLLIFTK